MKWRDIKILCAGMCVCTVIATVRAIVSNRIVGKEDAESRVEEFVLSREMTEICESEDDKYHKNK